MVGIVSIIKVLGTFKLDVNQVLGNISGKSVHGESVRINEFGVWGHVLFLQFGF